MQQANGWFRLFSQIFTERPGRGAGGTQPGRARPPVLGRANHTPPTARHRRACPAGSCVLLMIALRFSEQPFQFRR